MSDSRKAIEEDTEDYLALCQFYDERPATESNGMYAIYGDHAASLRKRYDEITVLR